QEEGLIESKVGGHYVQCRFTSRGNQCFEFSKDRFFLGLAFKRFRISPISKMGWRAKLENRKHLYCVCTNGGTISKFPLSSSSGRFESFGFPCAFTGPC